ncbi:hypothetical protein AK88_05056 [Plasmodium fragile]|uniref:Uncharacterized protein n=1 Tax=Plasmodium fragile TaxID=5857 RepID=A0A0D9QER9_PLAFR|nr:uncharacterized protein AK88_05056 [Plasmodium fragile]KJP85302.1 hypothetical protein AK88_05056 [Plasmodium fragile]
MKRNAKLKCIRKQRNIPHITNYEFSMDEPVTDTVIRDAKSIYKKILHICFHQYDDDNTVKKCNAYLEY